MLICPYALTVVPRSFPLFFDFARAKIRLDLIWCSSCGVPRKCEGIFLTKPRYDMASAESNGEVAAGGIAIIVILVVPCTPCGPAFNLPVSP
jgi:hypothetical protein